MISKAEQKIRTYSYMALSYIFAEARAYEYLTLEPFSGKYNIIESLQNFGNTSELVQNLHEARIGLSAWNLAAQSQTMSRAASCWSSLTFPISAMTSVSPKANIPLSMMSRLYQTSLLA